MSLAAIRSALDTRLAAAGLDLDLAWENAPYRPTEGRPWAAVRLQPSRTAPLGIGRLSPIRRQGGYRIDLNFPTDAGAGPATQAAEALAAWFARGLGLVAADTTILLDQPEIGAGQAGPVWFTLPVTAAWIATSPT